MSNGFNPVLGFLSTATVSRLRIETSRQVSIPCWVFCPLRRGRLVLWTELGSVSIPCWVFCPLRPSTNPRPIFIDSVCFNPVLGFLSTATRSPPLSTTANPSFNPVLGFLSTATRRPSSSALSGGSFNPVLGFLSTATSWASASTGTSSGCFNPVLGFLSTATCSRKRVCRTDRVSIPCWVFCPLRRFGSESCVTWPRSFNPVLGFLSTATRHDTDRDSDGQFQSRAGFSVHCDLLTKEGVPDRSSFNPVLGFLSTATLRFRELCHLASQFQSRAGFSVHCDTTRHRPRFRWTVSIPCWVFCPLRPADPCVPINDPVRFNPVLGFLSTATCRP